MLTVSISIYSLTFARPSLSFAEFWQPCFCAHLEVLQVKFKHNLEKRGFGLLKPSAGQNTQTQECKLSTSFWWFALYSHLHQIFNNRKPQNVSLSLPVYKKTWTISHLRPKEFCSSLSNPPGDQRCAVFCSCFTGFAFFGELIFALFSRTWQSQKEPRFTLPSRRLAGNWQKRETSHISARVLNQSEAQVMLWKLTSFW